MLTPSDFVVGEEVILAYGNGETIYPIEKITPTGKIKVNGVLFDPSRSNNGVGIMKPSPDRWGAATWLYKKDSEYGQKILREKEIKRLKWRLSEAMKKVEDLEILKQIAVLIGEK